MNNYKHQWPKFLFLALVLSATATQAQQLRLSFQEVAQNSHLIFVGTVERKETRFNAQRTMIFTDVYFKDHNVVHATSASVQREAATIKLTHGGGELDGYSIEVSETPRLSIGHRYLILMSDDGLTYANPIIGGSQGVYEVIKDSVSGKEYLLSLGGKAIIGVNSQGISLSKSQVARIESGVIIPQPAPAAPLDNFVGPAAIAELSRDSATTHKPSDAEGQTPLRPLGLKEFLSFIRTMGLESSFERGSLRRNGEGAFYERVNGQMEAQPLTLQSGEPNIPFMTTDDLAGPSSTRSSSVTEPLLSSPSGGTLGACGYHTLPLVMEQVPASFWSYPIVNDNMYTWNVFMDLFRFTTSDGFFGNNSQNEFGAFATDATLFSVYGFHWNGALAVAITFRGSQCGRITQADVLWNSAYSWTTDANFALGNSGVILLRPVNQHETGHVWGLQTGAYAETYDYDQATVMHSYYSTIVEDGWGIHAADAYLIRRHYDDQTGIIARNDVGVESYYASNGLKNSTTNTSSYSPGQSIILSGVTAENMSNTAVSDMRIRFYLSTNRTISTSDYQMGSYWYWTSFPAEAYNVANYTTTIPANLPSGTYYVGAIISINGYGSDDFSYNNATSFYYPITISGSAGSPNLTPYKPAGWSDKIVVSTATGTSTDSSPLKTTDTLYIDWAVLNNGTANINSTFNEQLYVDGILKQTFVTNPPLNTNSYTFFQDYSIGSLSAGTHTIKIVADSGGVISESSESDNEYTKTITVSAAQSCNTLTANVSPNGGGTVTINVPSNCSTGAAAPETAITAEEQAIIVADVRSSFGSARSAAMEEAFGKLIAKAEASGPISVIVGLNVPYQPEGKLLVSSAIQEQRISITESQDRVLSELSSYDQGSVKRYSFIPAMALKVDAADLRRLEASQNVSAIAEDLFLPLTLAQSVPLIGTSAAWASGFTGSGQTVAVLDTGVDKTHPFLAGKVVSEACYSGNLCPGGGTSSTSPGSGVNCNVSIAGCDHGTHVAGIAAGKGSSFSGVAKDASIIAIQVFTNSNGSLGASDSDILSGLQRVQALSSTFNIAAVNLSLGGGLYTSNCDSVNPMFKAAVDSLRSVGIATVIASGNTGSATSISYPACISTAVSVGSTDDGSGGTVADGISTFSNSASFLKLLAPGRLINSSVPGGGFANFQGTSMATPHVVGAWAVLKSKSPSASVTQILTAFSTTGLLVTDPRNNITKPRIKVDAALNALGGGSSGQYASGTVVTLTPVANSGYSFQSWSGCDSVSGSNCTVTMNASRSVTANFSPINQVQVTVQTNPSGRSFTVDGSAFTSTQTFTWSSGSSHTISTTSPQSGSTGTRYSWGNWSDGGAISHTVSPTSSTTYTANFTTQYFLTMNAGAGGTVSPPSNWFNSGQGISISATPNSGFSFSGWTGSGSGSFTGSANPGNVTMNGPITETANFSGAPSTNFARTSNGGLASASSTTPNSQFPGYNFLPGMTNDGDRRSGVNFWRDNTASAYPDWLQVDFNGIKSITEIDVFTLQDNDQNPADPTQAMTFSVNGITAFEVQYWTGSAWVTVPNGSVTGNNKVWRQFAFSAITTSKVRVLVNNALNARSRIVELEAYGTAAGPVRNNVARAANGGVVSASSEQSPYTTNYANDGERQGYISGHYSFWRDNTNSSWPDWLQIDFNSSKTIDEIDVFTVQDNAETPSEPTESLAFSLHGITAFEVQYWNGSAWVTVPGGSVTGNNKVWRKFTFAAITTSKVRVLVNNALNTRSRIVELEAWGTAASSSNHALGANGGLASASSTTPNSQFPGYNFLPGVTNDGDRRSGVNFWRDDTANAYPDWLQVDFNGNKSITEIDVFTLQDNDQNPADPNQAMTFSVNGITAFEVQYWTGSAWVTVPNGSVTGNNKVWRQFTFSAITTSKIRVLVNNALNARSRIVELEAY